MAKSAQCGDCGGMTPAVTARAVIRATGVVLLCANCHGNGQEPVPSSAPAKTSRRSAALLDPPVAAAPPPTPPIPRGRISSAPELDDYDEITMMPNEEMPDEEMPDEEMPDEEMPDEEESSKSANSAGQDYASASGAIELDSRKAARRDKADPTPAVVVSSDRS